MTSSVDSGGSRAAAYDNLGNLTRKFTACTTPNCMTYGGTGYGPHQLASLSGSFNGQSLRPDVWWGDAAYNALGNGKLDFIGIGVGGGL